MDFFYHSSFSVVFVVDFLDCFFSFHTSFRSLILLVFFFIFTVVSVLVGKNFIYLYSSKVKSFFAMYTIHGVRPLKMVARAVKQKQFFSISHEAHNRNCLWLCTTELPSPRQSKQIWRSEEKKIRAKHWVDKFTMLHFFWLDVSHIVLFALQLHIVLCTGIKVNKENEKKKWLSKHTLHYSKKFHAIQFQISLFHFLKYCM